ncbi:MAG TPA: MGMT family protein [Roseiflexaceae bacterium]|jgi:methylated-DNA-protein-cysteine methyltransferase-like protein|nr:MGMT family protein [Roseiflexaceae bacterium]
MNASPDYALYETIYTVVAEVPHGKVATYGDIAAIVGGGCDARTVGYALNELPEGREQAVPWQRVINREGGISTRGLRQRELLEAEGVAFDAQGRVIMARCRWAGPGAAWAAEHGFNTLPPRDDAEQLSLF